MNKLKTDKGISLIALVITVIVMLLLAFVVTGVINTGLFDRAKKASDLYINTSDNDPNLINNTIGSLRNLVVKTPVGENPPVVTPPVVTPPVVTPPEEPPIIVIPPDLKPGDVTFTCTPNTWTNGDVTVTIATTVPGYTLQYSTNGTTWTNYTTGVVYTTNGDIYARLTDGTNSGGYVTESVTNIDKTAPVVGTITSTTNSITFTATDVGSRNKSICSKYIKHSTSKWLDKRIGNNITRQYNSKWVNAKHNILCMGKRSGW